MTRAASWVGLGLGTLLFLYGLGEVVRSSPGPLEVAALVLGLGTFVCARLTAHGSNAGQLTLIGLSLAALAWFLPAYFGSYRVWPGLVVVALASTTFGVGLLGYLLDRHPDPGRPGTRL